MVLAGSGGVAVVALVVALTTGQAPGLSGRAADPPAATTEVHARPSVAPSAGTDGKKSGSSAKPRPSGRVHIPARGPRSYRLADTSARPLGKRGALITYNVRVEKGLPYDPEDTARFIHQTLNDRRSWGRSGQWRLKLVGPGTKADVGVYLVTPKTTDALCKPLQTEGRVSCFNKHRVVLNADRWAYGAASYRHDLIDYRRNVVNHEFGHSLGFGHVTCPARGRLAPIMMQQTKGLHGCRANPWPYPKR